jgi:hypothetical protein
MDVGPRVFLEERDPNRRPISPFRAMGLSTGFQTAGVPFAALGSAVKGIRAR